MDIQDAVATVIYHDTIARPEQYPEEVLCWARGIADLQRNNPTFWTIPTLHEASGTWEGFKRSLQEYSGQLPEICTENE